jgi:DNA-binding transcriptional ArsR family regulator
MSNHKIKFAKLELKMVYSKAYQDLNAPTLKILSYLLLQLRWVNTAKSKDKPNYVCENKDNIVMTYSTFKKSPFKMSQPTIVRAVDSLLEHGFIKIKDQGGRCRGHKTIYQYSEKWGEWEPGQKIFSRLPFFARGFCN